MLMIDEFNSSKQRGESVIEFEKDQVLQAPKINKMTKSMKINIEKVEAADNEADNSHDTSQSSEQRLNQNEVHAITEKIDMRGVFRVHGAMISYSVQSSPKGYTFTLDVKTDTSLDKLFKKEKFATHVEHSAYGKLRKTGSMRITTRKTLRTIHEVFREEIESLCASIIQEDQDHDKWIGPLKQAISQKFAGK